MIRKYLPKKINQEVNLLCLEPSIQRGKSLAVEQEGIEKGRWRWTERYLLFKVLTRNVNEGNMEKKISPSFC